MRPWFERDAALLEREIDALKAAGVAVEVDEGAREAGILRLQLVYPDDPPVKLVATYPDFFPFFRPEVRSADLKLGRHQNPIGGNLCLIGRRTSRWYAEETLADTLKLQMPRLLDYARTGDAEPLAEVEEPQGEPASEYYNSDSPVGSYLLFDGRWSIPAQVQEGSFLAKCRRLPHDGALPLKIQGYVAEIRSSDGKALARWEGKPLEAFPESIHGKWLRRAAPILGDINFFKEELGEQWDSLMDEARWPPQRHVALGAVLFPEEVQHQEFGDGWAVMQWVASRRKKGLPRSITGSFVRAARAGPTDLAARMPAAATLSDKSVVFFGLGAVRVAGWARLCPTPALKLRVHPETQRPQLSCPTCSSRSVWPYKVNPNSLRNNCSRRPRGGSAPDRGPHDCRPHLHFR